MELTELGLSEEQLTGVNSYLEETLNSKLQSEGDKIRTKYNNEITGYKTKITDYDKKIEELTAKIPVTKSESEIEFENRIKAIEDREKEVAKKEQLTNIQKQLSDKGVNGELAEYLNLNIPEGTDLETYLSKLVEVVGKQANTTYKPKSHVQTTTITKEDFKKMSYYDKINLYNTNKELFNSLNGK